MKYFLAAALALFSFSSFAFELGDDSENTQYYDAETYEYEIDGIIPSMGPLVQESYRDDRTDDLVPLGQKINDGSVSLSDLPFLGFYILDLLLKMAGTITLFVLMFNGAKLIFSGITENKEDAKKGIQYGLLGLVIAALAWNFVDWVQIFMTK